MDPTSTPHGRADSTPVEPRRDVPPQPPSQLDLPLKPNSPNQNYVDFDSSKAEVRRHRKHTPIKSNPKSQNISPKPLPSQDTTQVRACWGPLCPWRVTNSRTHISDSRPAFPLGFLAFPKPKRRWRLLCGQHDGDSIGDYFLRPRELSPDRVARGRDRIGRGIGFLAIPIMEAGSQYWARPPRHVQARAPNIQTLRYWGSCLKGPWRRRFEKLHGNLLSLLEVETQPTALEALAQYYDSPVRCFTIKDFQMAPTLEEYERLLGLPLTESPLYLHQG
ncbi:hypothetical protein CR513_23752, partial [Mucuna pruriens]